MNTSSSHELVLEQPDRIVLPVVVNLLYITVLVALLATLLCFWQKVFFWYLWTAAVAGFLVRAVAPFLGLWDAPRKYIFTPDNLIVVHGDERNERRTDYRWQDLTKIVIHTGWYVRVPAPSLPYPARGYIGRRIHLHFGKQSVVIHGVYLANPFYRDDLSRRFREVVHYLEERRPDLKQK